MAIDYKPDQNEYKNMTPFKTWLMYQINTWGVNNFPFLENDFDQLTNYGMMMKLMKSLNDNINNQNLVEEDMTKLYGAFTELQTYINNYFDNLDIQTEVDNKLDEMAESGQLADIVAQYLKVASVLGFDTKASLKSADNLVNGSITRTLGESSYNDGKGSYYKIRTVTSGDVIDDNNILALANFPTLIAEKIISEVELDVNTLKINMSLLTNKKILFIGDSYLEMFNGSTGIIDKFKEISNITNIISSVKSGTGFEYTVENQNFITLLQNVPNDNEITDIICVGGYNDQYSNQTDVETAISTFCSIAKQKFPNAKIYIGMDGFTLETNKRFPIFNVFQTYQKCNKYGAIYLNGIECVMHDTSLFIGETDLTHPNENGRFELAKAIYQSWKSGLYSMNREYNTLPTHNSGDVTSGNFILKSMIINNITYILHQQNDTLYFENKPSYDDIHNVNIEIGALDINLENANFSPWPYNMYPIPVTCVVHDRNGYRTMNGKIQFLNNNIYLVLEDVETSNWTDIQELEDIEINTFQATFPTPMC